MPPKSKQRKPVTVTLLSGFLGSGKTSLMRHVLSNKQGLRCAVVVNEISELNLDADALMGTKLIKADEQLVEMANGCICCTLREDLLKQLRELSSSGRFDCVLIESSGIAEPMQVAETFFVDLEDGHGQLQSKCALDNCVTVVDASTFMDYMESVDTVSTIDPTATASQDQHDIAQLFVDQLEFANVVILNKTDLLHNGDINSLKALIHKISPRAKIITATHSRVPVTDILRTGNFSLDFAIAHGEWMDDIKSGVKHVPETLEYGVSSYMFRATKPFHPTRLYEWITRNFVLNQMKAQDDDEDFEEDEEEQEGEDETYDGVDNDNKTSVAVFDEDQLKAQQAMREEAKKRKQNCTGRYGNLFRSKGFIWIGSPQRDPLFGEWSQAGTLLSLFGGGTWDELPQPSSRKDPNLQPQQLLSFVGQNLNTAQLEADLYQLLMTDAEMHELDTHLQTKGPTGTLFEDKFEQWATIWPDDNEADENDQLPSSIPTSPVKLHEGKASKAAAAQHVKTAGKKSTHGAVAHGAVAHRTRAHTTAANSATSGRRRQNSSKVKAHTAPKLQVGKKKKNTDNAKMRP